jgi:hypothetical protein
MSLPYEGYYTGVSGYSAQNKAVLIIKNGWIVGEYYNRTNARTAVYYLASNGNTFAMMLFGRLLLNYPSLGIDLNSRLYDERWLSAGFPLTDARKADITFHQVFGHVSIYGGVSDGPAVSARWSRKRAAWAARARISYREPANRKRLA